MNFLSFISDAIIPVFIFIIIAAGVIRKQNVYEEFLEGAKDGLKIVLEIVPTIIGLMVAVGVLRASGFLDAIANVFQQLLSRWEFPKEIIPVAIIKMFSSSAATGLLLDIFKEKGADSNAGIISSIMLSSTETIFYTMSVYFMSVKVKKTRWTLPGTLIATISGIIASIWLGSRM